MRQMYKEGDSVYVNGVEYTIVRGFKKKIEFSQSLHTFDWYYELSDGTTVHQTRIDKPSYKVIKYMRLEDDCTVKKHRMKVPLYAYGRGKSVEYIANVLSVDKTEIQI